MKWRKLGRVYCPTGELPWARRYASFPTVEVQDSGAVRVHVTCLDDQDFGRGGYVDLDPRDLTKVISCAQTPALDLGQIGDFDDAGANPFTVLEFGGRTLVYYQGWQRTLRAPYAIFTGVAARNADGSFTRWRRTPVLERTDDEPHLRAAPFVMHHDGMLRMWYVGSGTWSNIGGRLYYHVNIRHAVSEDGVHWSVDPKVCIAPNDAEYAVGRPVVLLDGSTYRMWYSIRSFDRPYAIGYAESEDGRHWVRLDHAVGIARSESGWDSEMICYGYVVQINGQLAMFYNGNRHGSTGFGCALQTD